MTTATSDRDKRFVASDMADSFRQFSRNGRWGTCAHCPRDVNSHAYPEFCEHTGRSDHDLSIDQLADKHNRYVARVESGEISHRR